MWNNKIKFCLCDLIVHILIGLSENVCHDCDQEVKQDNNDHHQRQQKKCVAHELLWSLSRRIIIELKLEDYHPYDVLEGSSQMLGVIWLFLLYNPIKVNLVLPNEVKSIGKSKHSQEKNHVENLDATDYFVSDRD